MPGVKVMLLRGGSVSSSTSSSISTATNSNDFEFTANTNVMPSSSSSSLSKQLVKDSIESGECQIVVGTHAILQSDIHFKSLGLLVVDEEQVSVCLIV